MFLNRLSREEVINSNNIEGVVRTDGWVLINESYTAVNNWFVGIDYAVNVFNVIGDAHYYVNNKIFRLRLSERYFNGHCSNVRLEVLTNFDRETVFEGVIIGSKALFMPLKDGLYVFAGGSIVCKIDTLPLRYGIEYSTVRKIKELLLC